MIVTNFTQKHSRLPQSNRIKQAKAALLAIAAGFALASVSSARATVYNNDLLVGFTVQSGNDLIYDLGDISSLTNGKAWNLSSLLTGYNLNVVNWGVIGDKYAGGVRTSWITTDGTYVPNPVPSRTAWANIDTATATMYQFFPAIGAGQYQTVDTTESYSWNQETINGLNSFTSYISVKANPNVVGLTSATFFSQVANGSAATNIGTFSLSGSGILTFNVVASMPPPPKIVSITRSGSSSTIFFTTTNGTYTYSLRYTNSAGLTVPVANWPVLPTTLTGNGLTNGLSDTTTDTNRFYRIGVQ